MFPSSTKREIRHFHVVVVQRQQRNVPKSVMHVQSYCFANLNRPIALLPFSLPSPWSLLKLPIDFLGKPQLLVIQQFFLSPANKGRNKHLKMKITGLRIQTDRRQTIWLFKIVTDKLNSGVSLRQIQLAVTAGFERGASGSKFQRSNHRVQRRCVCR